MKRNLIWVGGVVFLVSILRLTVFHYLYYKEVAVIFNPMSGETNLVTKAGWNPFPPWILFSTIDIKPERLCITSASRAVNCKLVEFKPEEYKEFLTTEGFRLYWWANRLSWNSGYNEEYRGMRDILRGYAFGNHKYSFISVTDDFSGSQR